MYALSLGDRMTQVTTRSTEWRIPTSTSVIDAHWGDLRHEAKESHAAAVQDHRDHSQSVHDDAYDDLRATSIEAMLNELAEDFGFAWTEIARVMKVSVPALRKWRLGGGASPEKRELLRHFVSFCRAIERIDPAASPYASMTNRLVPTHTITVLDAFRTESVPHLLELALKRGDAREILDEIVPGWRLDYDANGFTVEHTPEGAIIRREGDVE